MNDELIDRLLRTARQDDLLADPRWDALASGELTGEARAAFEAEMSRTEAGRSALLAFAPIDPAERARIADRVSPPKAPPAPPPQKRPRGPALFLLAAALAVAIALVVIVLVLPSRSPPSPLAHYQLVVEGGESPLRADTPPPPGPTRLGPGSQLTVFLRPATRVEGRVDFRPVLLRGGAVTPWKVSVDVSEEGTARIAGTREQLFPGLPDGPVEIAVLAGRPEDLPASWPSPSELVPGRRAPYQVLRASVELVPAAP